MNIGPAQFRNQNGVDDESLMIRVRDDACRESFSELYERWNLKIHRACFRLTGNWQDAEDSVQEVFRKLFRGRQGYDTRARFSTWLWTIAINQTRDLARKKSRDRARREAVESHLVRHTQPRAGTEMVELRDEVRNALLKLPEPLREIVVLRHYEGMTFAEMAGLLAIPQGTVASRMARALQQLQRHLQPDGPDDERQ